MISGDGLDIPAFLIVTPAEQERRDAWNATHPIAAAQFLTLKPSGNTEDDEVWKAREDERKAVEKAASMKRLLDHKAKQKMESEVTPRDGQVWKNGKYVRSDAISAARAARIMSELPTASMRQIFTEQYGHRVEGGIVWPPVKPKETKGKKRGDIH